jgi:hypothetical protein
MRLLVNAFVMLVAAGIGLAVGIVWREQTPATPPWRANAEAGAPTLPKAKRFFAGRPGAARAMDDSPLTTKLERDLSMSSGVTRWLCWFDALEQAKLGDFPRLAQLARSNPAAARLVAACWIERDPRHLFDTLLALRETAGFPSGELANALFYEWPKRDPAAAIAALSQPEARNRHWRTSVATRVFENDVERGLRLFADWQIVNYAPDMKSVAKWTAADPRHAAEFTIANQAGYASKLAMEAVGKEWAKTDPAGALQFAADRPGELGTMLQESAMKAWAARDLTGAAKWLAEADPATRNRISASFVEAWAKKDAPSALAWCEANLGGSSLAQAIGGVMTGAAAKNVDGAAKLVAAMAPSLARAEAAAVVAQKWIPEPYTSKPIPPEALGWLGGLDAEAVNKVLDRTYWKWAGLDPRSIAHFLIAPGREGVSERIYSGVARNLSRLNPGEAQEWAAQLPAERRVATGSAAFDEWQFSQPEAAVKWLNGLPVADPRRTAYKPLGKK